MTRTSHLVVVVAAAVVPVALVLAQPVRAQGQMAAAASASISASAKASAASAGSASSSTTAAATVAAPGSAEARPDGDALAAPALGPAPSVAASAEASASATPGGEPAVPSNLAKLIFEDGRKPFRKPIEGGVTLDFHGELQLRGEVDSALPLQPPVSDPTLTRLGQRQWATEWLRIGGQLTVGKALRVFVQLELIPRWVFGDVAQGVSAAGDAARDTETTSFARLRYAYVDYTTPLGLLRIGQVGSHWGLGILANDGDHQRLFGDYRIGSLVERIAFASRPGGKDSPFVVALAGDLVLQDQTAKYADGDRAYQAVLAAYYEKNEHFLGFYGVRRWQKVANDEGHTNVWVADVAGKTAVPVGEEGNLFAYAGAEGAAVFGKTDAIRSTPEFNEQKVRTYGGAINIGIVRRAKDARGKTYGTVAVQLDGGYASADADPYDGTVKRFTFDPNYQVGLVMFPFVMHFMTARAATNAGDPDLVARGLPGTRFLPSKGGMFGAQYLNPTIVFRPHPTFDLKAGLLVAIASGDMVDPYRTTLEGSNHNYRGGPARSRDLGTELDFGFEWRVALSSLVTAQLGFQGGVMVPGHAFDDARGNRMKSQSVMQLRLGLQF
jgi:hypothetical protein